MIVSKISGKGQTTIPPVVRKALHLRAGDCLRYQIDNGQVILTRTTTVPWDDPFAAFGEWAGDADRCAYATL